MEIHLPITYDAHDNAHIRQPHTTGEGATERAEQLGREDERIWRYEVLTFDLIEDRPLPGR
jgi:hypothetical protein